MINIQKKHVMISSPLVFSLCCFSPLYLHPISFQDLLSQSRRYPFLLVEKESIPSNSPLKANEESVSVLWHPTNLPFPLLSDTSLTTGQPLHLSNIPVHVSYLQYILLQDKRDRYTLSPSVLPQLFYHLVPKNSLQVSFENTLKQPYILIHPIKETLSLDTLLEAHSTAPLDLLSYDSHAQLPVSNVQYILKTKQAQLLAIDKHPLTSGTLHPIDFLSIPTPSSLIFSEISFALRNTQPSVENTTSSENLSPASNKYPTLGEVPVNLYEFTSSDTASPIGNFLPATQTPSPQMSPLSYNDERKLSLPKHLSRQPAINTPVSFSHSIEPLALHRVSPSLEPYIQWKHQSLLFAPDLSQISIESFLSFHNFAYPRIALYHAPFVSFQEEKISLKSDPYTTDALVSYVAAHTSLVPQLFTSVTDAIDTSLIPQKHEPLSSITLTLTLPTFKELPLCSYAADLSIKNPLYISANSLYIRSTPDLKQPTYLSLEERAKSLTVTDSLISHLAEKQAPPALIYTSMQHSKLAQVFPEPHHSIPSISISCVISPFQHLSILSIESPVQLNITDTQSSSSLYAPQYFLSADTYSLAEKRMLSPHLMDELESINPNHLSLHTDFSIKNSILPDKEHAFVASIIDYPLLQRSDTPIVNHGNPFLLSYTWQEIPLSTIPALSHDKKYDDTTIILKGMLSLLEPIGNQQPLEKTTYVHQPLSIVHPKYESSFSAPNFLSETPNPNYFSVFQNTLLAPLTFNNKHVIASVNYKNIPVTDSAKQSLPTAESLLSSELELLKHPYSCSVTQDIPNTLRAVGPYSETAHFLSYQKLYEAKLNHYSLSTEKATYSSHIPKLSATAHLSPDLVSSKLDFSPSRKNASLLNQSSRHVQENLAHLPTLQDLRTLSFSEEFSVDVQVMQNTKGSGYLFSITLEPTLKQMSSGSAQNFIFLVDRSSSIDKNRFQVFTQAINKSLLYLKEEDTFNILSFDTEISKMSHESVSVSSSTKHGAKRFLEAQKRGYKYVLPNLYSILLNVQAMVKDSPLPTTVILLTNGKSLENFNTQDERLAQLIAKNQNGFTLFTACSSQNNNTLMLEILSNLNRGELMHSQTNAAFPRKLAALVKHAGSLIAKDIHVSAAQTNSNVNIEFFPDTALAPNLYGDRPYTIVGKINQLSDFDLVLQGRFCENWLNVTKKISFKTARRGGHSIYKDYTMHMAYNKYREFLKEGNTAYLDEAKKVLQPFNTSLPY